MRWLRRAIGTNAALLLALALSGRARAQESATAPGEPVPDSPAPPQAIDVESFLRGQGQGMTSEQAARRAVATAPSIDSARAQLRAARAGADRALAALFPRLELSGRYTRLSEIQNPNLFSGQGITPEQERMAREAIAAVEDPAARALFLGNLEAQLEQQRAFSSFSFPVILDQWAFGLAWTVPVTDAFLQIWPAYEAADGAARAQREQLRARASEIAQQAREAYYSYARARGALAVARAALSAVQLQERMVAAMVRAGTAAAVDLARVQAQVAASRVAELRAEAGVRIAETALRTLLHADDEESIAIAENLLAPLPEVNEPLASLVAEGLQRRAELLAMRRLVQVRSRQIDAAEGSRWPHVALAGNLTYANPNPRIFPQRQEFRETWDLSVVLSWSPNDFAAGELQAAEARAARAQAEADLRALEDGVRLQVIQAYESYRAARAAIEAAAAGVQAAEEALRVRTEQYRAGASTVTELVLAVSDRARAQLDRIGAAIDARVAYAQLRRAIGADGPYEGLDE